MKVDDERRMIVGTSGSRETSVACSGERSTVCDGGGKLDIGGCPDGMGLIWFRSRLKVGLNRVVHREVDDESEGNLGGRRR